VLCLPLLAFLAGASSHSPNAAATPAVESETVAEAPGDTLAELAMKDPIAFLNKCLERYDDTVRGYDCTLVKQERIGGQLQPEQFITLRVRQQPFSVYLKWQGPKPFEGQEAAFVAGKNNNKMRAKGAGLAGAVGFLSLDPTDARAMRQTRHAITETGIGHLIETVARGYEVERRLPPSQVQTRFADYAFQQRPCTRMEAVHLVNNGQFYCHRCVVYFDKGMKLPVRFEAYDWPAAGGNPQGELLECYSYIDLKFNVGLTDAAFGF
jgi:hypothetical protein